MEAIVLVFGYLLICVFIGTRLSSSSNNAAKFFVTKKELGVICIIPYIFSEMISGGGTIGIAQSGFLIGLSSVWVNWGMVLGIVIMLYLTGDFYYTMGTKLNCITVPEVFEYRFDRRCRVLLSVILCLSYLIMVASNSKAIAVIVESMTGIRWEILSFLFSAIFIIVACVGGQKGVIYTNIIHSFVMYFSLGVACVLTVHYVGGLQVMKNSLDSTYFRLDQPNLSTCFARCTSSIFSFLISSPLVAMIFGAKDRKTIQSGFWISSILMAVFALFPALIGMAGKVNMPDAVSGSILYTMPEGISFLLSVVVVMGVVAALFSSSPAVLMLCSTMLINDIVKLGKPGMTDREQIRLSRIFTAVLGLGCTLAGMNVSTFLAQQSGAFQIRAIAGLVAALSIYWGRIDSRAAFWSMALGGGISAYWHLADMASSTGISALWCALIVGIPVLLILTLLNRKGDAKGYTNWRAAYAEMKAEHQF